MSAEPVGDRARDQCREDDREREDRQEEADIVQVVTAARKDDREQRRMRIRDGHQKTRRAEAHIFAAGALVDEIRRVVLFFGLGSGAHA